MGRSGRSWEGWGMSSDWPIVEIEQVCELIVDCVNKTAPVVS